MDPNPKIPSGYKLPSEYSRHLADVRHYHSMEGETWLTFFITLLVLSAVNFVYYWYGANKWLVVLMEIVYTGISIWVTMKAKNSVAEARVLKNCFFVDNTAIALISAGLPSNLRGKVVANMNMELYHLCEDYRKKNSFDSRKKLSAMRKEAARKVAEYINEEFGNVWDGKCALAGRLRIASKE